MRNRIRCYGPTSHKRAGRGARGGAGATTRVGNISKGHVEVLFIGTQFSNLSTAVDTSAAAACNAWCVCVFFPSFYLFFEASHPADVSAPVYSGSSAFSLRLTPSRLTPGATSALLSPPRFHLCPSSPFGRPFHIPPPPRLLLYTVHTLCDKVLTSLINK